MTVRERLEAGERESLSPLAVRSGQSRGRAVPEPECDLRTCFMRDIDRVTYSKAFRRLKHKTQVFLQPERDHYRTRLSHTLEVARIARTITRALRLNEDLTEAIALAHDLGHTPFGHAGENALREAMRGDFSHNEQGVRVVSRLEKGGHGLNLTFEVLDGILKHVGNANAVTLEGRIVHYADRIAYINHDIDDAIRAGVLLESELPRDICDRLGYSHSSRINTLVSELIEASSEEADIGLPADAESAMNDLREFMFEHVYKNPVAKGEESKARDMLLTLFDHYNKNPGELPDDCLEHLDQDGLSRVVCDYIAGMTDRFAVAKFMEIYIPRGWQR